MASWDWKAKRACLRAEMSVVSSTMRTIRALLRFRTWVVWAPVTIGAGALVVRALVDIGGRALRALIGQALVCVGVSALV